MKKSKIFLSPLSVSVGKKKFILNLNQYRNTHYRVKNNAKRQYKDIMEGQIKSVKKKISRAIFIYTVYKGDKRAFDIGNICSIHQKFFEDALVELGKMEDDKFTNIPLVIYCLGGIDDDNPRVEIEVIPVCIKDFPSISISKVHSKLAEVYNNG